MEKSSTLQNNSWASGTNLFRVVGNPTDNGDGSETVTVEFSFPLGSTSRFHPIKPNYRSIDRNPTRPSSISYLR